MLNHPIPRGAAAFLPLALLLCLAAAACSQADSARPIPAAKAESAPSGLADGAKEATASGPAPVALQPDLRKRIVTGSLDLQVSDLKSSLAALNARLPALSAYLASSQTEASWASLVIRVPAERYDGLVGDLGGIGKVLRSSTAAEDVTDQWFDLDNRVRSKRILQERYLAYLRVAKNVEDLMAIERQVNEVTAEIEQLEGSFKRLSNQVAYSTLTVNLSLPGSPDRGGYDLGAALQDFLRNVGDFFQAALVVMLYLVVVGVPLVMVAALCWWLLFGRIGWLRRLFRRLGRSRPEA